MSWDLFFYASRDRPLASAALIAYLRSTGTFALPSAEPAPAAFEATYFNPLTHVRLVLDFRAPTAAHAGEDRFVDAGLSANLNYMRCSFFAHEAMPVLEQLARALDLLVLDPQDESGDDVAECTAANLIRSWEYANAQAVRSSAAYAPQLLYMPRERALAWWRTIHEFGLVGEKLQDRLHGEDLQVSTPLLYRRTGSVEVFRTAILIAEIAQVVPDCDYFEVFRPSTSGGVGPEDVESGWVAAHLVLAALEGRLEPLPGSPDRHHLLHQARAEGTARFLQSLPLDPLLAFEPATIHEIVDIDFRTWIARPGVV